jgi:hypothetical protein
VPTGRNGEKLLEGGVGRFTDSSFVVEKVRFGSRTEQYFCLDLLVSTQAMRSGTSGWCR